MKKIYIQIILLVLVCIAVVYPSQAEIKLPSVFTSHMVLQQKTEVAIWGWSDARSEVTLITSWNNEQYSTKADRDGKWILKVKTPEAGGPFEITLNDGVEVKLEDILIGEVWLCSGQSNMEMPMKGFRGQPVKGSNIDILKSKNSNIRLISVPRSSKTVPQNNFEGAWRQASPETVARFSATAYYFGRLVNEMLDVPVGLIDVSFGGSCVQAWMSSETSVSFEDKKVPAPEDTIPVPNRTPTVLYNGMLHPVIGYGIKGCIWYQGETNYIEPDRYEELFPLMVAEWRKRWNIGDFPFYYMQIAPFGYSAFTPTEFHEKYNSAYLRDAQRKVQSKIPNSGMAVLMDLGEEKNIHPVKKKEAGQRLALWALAHSYGLKGFGYKSPSFTGINIKGSQITVSFKDTPNGLTSFGKKLKHFEIAGKNKVFYPATAFLRSKSVVLSSPHVNDPVAVRYAFKDFVVGDLFGTDGLPASSFRTDNW